MPTSEGGLGFRSLKEVNTVNGLKLIWRFLSGNSLWGRWIRMYLTKKKHFWEIGEKSQQGFWMWRKFLKLRDIAKTFHMKAIGNGMATSFWYDKWLEMGTLMNKLGDRGIIDLGFRREATVYEVLCSTRARRRHRTALLNEVEQQITLCRQRQRMNEDDCDLRGRRSGYNKKYSTRETWHMLRQARQEVHWAEGVWFKYATPKFSFITWLAMLNRLSTMDRVVKWSSGIDTTCVLCKSATETRDHIFFECSYSSLVWEKLTRGILKRRYTNCWLTISGFVGDITLDRIPKFCIRYSFQCAIHMIWRERNQRRHGEVDIPAATMEKHIDKAIRNRLCLLSRSGDNLYRDALSYWFGSRLNS